MKTSTFIKNFKTLSIFSIVLLSLLSFKTNDKIIVVSKDGKGNFTTVQQAIDAVENSSSTRTKILIKAGVYKEKITIPETKGPILLEGENSENTIITMILLQKRIRKEKILEQQVLQRFLFIQMTLRQEIFHLKTVQEKSDKPLQS
jgi:hypothetical protein